MNKLSYLIDTLRIFILIISNIDGVIDNLTDKLVGNPKTVWYFIEELFICKYKKIPFTNIAIKNNEKK